jgi:hypothetical protein
VEAEEECAPFGEAAITILTRFKKQRSRFLTLLGKIFSKPFQAAKVDILAALLT